MQEEVVGEGLQRAVLSQTDVAGHGERYAPVPGQSFVLDTQGKHVFLCLC